MTPAGSIDTRSDRMFIRVSGSFDSVESVREIGIQANGRLFRLGDIARVYRGYADPPSQKVRYTGKEAIALAVSMAKGGDILELGQDLEKPFARIKRDLPRRYRGAPVLGPAAGREAIGATNSCARCWKPW